MLNDVKVHRVASKPARAPKPIDTIHCRDWATLATAFDSLGGESRSTGGQQGRWIFRGHRVASWELESTLVRRFKDSWTDWAQGDWNNAMVLKRMEAQLTFDFSSKARLHGLEVSLERPVSLLSAMQHFGAPTRLLDWTYSPYVALYFALESQSESDSSAVWALNLSAIYRASTKKVLAVRRFKDGRRLSPPVQYVDFSRDDIFKKHVVPDLEDCHLGVLNAEPALDNVVPLLPKTLNERISAQQGLFLCPTKVGVPFMKQLEALMVGQAEKWATKIVVTSELRKEALRRLFQMNIHPLSLFPGVDGLGRFCGQKADLFGWE